MECLGFKQAQMITGLQEVDVPLYKELCEEKKILPWLLVITLECHVQSNPGYMVTFICLITYHSKLPIKAQQ